MERSDRERALVSIGAGEEQISLIKRMRELGYSVIAVDRSISSPGFAYSDLSITRGTFDAVPIIDDLEKLQERYDIKGVFNSKGGPADITTAAISSYFGLPGPSLQAASVLVDKSSLQRICSQNSIRVPETVTVSSPNYSTHITSMIPCVVKPALGLNGKRGITLVKETNQVHWAYREAHGASLNGKVIVEEYIEGVDVSLVAIVRGGTVLPIFLYRELNSFRDDGTVEIEGIRGPYTFTCDDDGGTGVMERFTELAQGIVHISGIEDSPLFVSAIITEKGALIPIEVDVSFERHIVLDELLPASAEFDYIKFAIKSMVEDVVEELPESFEDATVLYSEALEGDPYGDSRWYDDDGDRELPGWHLKGSAHDY